MKVLAADRYIPCRGLVRTLQLLQKDVFVTAADSIDEILARIPGLPDVDLVLLDATMPAMENFVGLRRVVEKLPDVVVTAPSESRAQIIAAIRNGESGYFPLSTKASVLRHVLPRIMSGEIYIPARAFRLDQGHAMRAPEGLAPRMRNTGAGFTPRQREIIVLLGKGNQTSKLRGRSRCSKARSNFTSGRYFTNSVSGIGPKRSSRPRRLPVASDLRHRSSNACGSRDSKPDERTGNLVNKIVGLSLRLGGQGPKSQVVRRCRLIAPPILCDRS
jgi:DNA-binding NarL/FixJ family response regulator